MSAFVCPHNRNVHIIDKCTINECPYHMSRVQDLFDLPKGDTDCVHYDSDIMQNVSNNRTQISALSRDPRRRLSPKLMRGSYDMAVEQTKTLHALTHSIATRKDYCRNCGYPTNGKLRCESSEVCKTRREWAKFICSQYSISISITKFQIIWDLLFKNEIATGETTKRTGLQLCLKKHVLGNPNIPQELLTSG